MNPRFACSLIAVVFLTISFMKLAAQSSSAPPVCEPSPLVRKALDALPEYRQDAALTDWQVYHRRLSTLKALLHEYPHDVFVQERYIESTTSMRTVHFPRFGERYFLTFWGAIMPSVRFIPGEWSKNL